MSAAESELSSSSSAARARVVTPFMFVFLGYANSPSPVAHSPFRNPRGEARLELDFPAQGGGGREGDAVELVAIAAELGCSGDEVSLRASL